MSGMGKKERQSNWELMRIIAMLMIVMGHFLGQSGFFEHAVGSERWVGAYIGNFHRIAVNMFLFLGIWFMVDVPFRARRLIQLYFNAWILTVLLTVAVIVFGFSYETKDVLRGMFPFIGKGVWFVSSYMALIMVSPWLKKVFLLPQRSHRNLVIVLFLLISMWVTLYSFDRMEDQWLDCLVWFAYSYIFIGYYKKYGLGIDINKWTMLGLGAFFYFAIVTIYNYCAFGSNVSAVMILGAKITRTLLMDYKTFPNLLIAMCFFCFFQNLKIGVSKSINYVASGAFTVYVFHQTPAFISVLWHQIYQCDTAFTRWNPLVYAVFVVFTVYFFGLFVERCRRCIEPFILNSAFVRWMEERIDKFYGK